MILLLASPQSQTRSTVRIPIRECLLTSHLPPRSVVQVDVYVVYVICAVCALLDWGGHA